MIYSWLLIASLLLIDTSSSLVPMPDLSRELSREDYINQYGHWKINAREKHSKYEFVHIPKNAGSSFMKESPHHLPINNTLHGNYENDACHTNGVALNKTLVLLRSPRYHVYSQFLECKYDPYFLARTKGQKFPRGTDLSKPVEGFEEWLKHVSAGRDDYKCYHPRNMQTRYMSCAGSQSLSNVGESELKKALNMTKNIGFLGISDHYTISVCAFEVFVSAAGTTKCYCANSTSSMTTKKSAQEHISHGVPNHSIKDLTSVHLQLIDNLTTLDDKLYKTALERFWIDVDRASKKSGVDLRCPHAGTHLHYD